MSRKHNTKHRRSVSNYPGRLKARGLSKSPRMVDYIGVDKNKRKEEGR